MLGCKLYLIDRDIEEVSNTLKKRYTKIINEKYDDNILAAKLGLTIVTIPEEKATPTDSESEKWIKIGHTKFDLHKCLPLEVNNPIAKVILWKPKGHKGTVVFANCDIDRIMYFINLENKFAITGIKLDLDLPGEDHYLPCYYFEHWDKDNGFRLVRVMCDPRWVFYEEGERFPFEQVEKYTERIKKKRLTNDMIKDYVTAMGWNIRDEGFFDSDQEAVFFTVKRW